MREDNPNALLLLFIHKEISEIAVVDEYAKRNQRRMTFFNPLQWFISSIRMYKCNEIFPGAASE